MQLSTDSLTDWIQVGLTLGGGIYALYLLNQSNKDKRILFVTDVLNRLYNDVEVRKILYAVDSGENADEIKFQGLLEKEADKTIRYLDYIGYLIKEKNISKKDIIPFEYEINRILDDQHIIRYIEWLETIGVNVNYLKHLK